MEKLSHLRPDVWRTCSPPSLSEMCCRAICRNNMRVPGAYYMVLSALQEHLRDAKHHGFCLGCGGVNYYMAEWMGLKQGLCPTCCDLGQNDLVFSKHHPHGKIACACCGKKTLPSRNRGDFDRDFQVMMLTSLSRMSFPHIPCQLCDKIHTSLYFYKFHAHEPLSFVCSVCSREFSVVVDDDSYDCPLWHRLGPDIKGRKDLIVCNNCRPPRSQVVFCKDNKACPMFKRIEPIKDTTKKRKRKGTGPWTRSPEFFKRIEKKTYMPQLPLFATACDLWVIEQYCTWGWTLPGTK